MIQQILEKSCEFFNIQLKDVKSKSRKREFTNLRMMVIGYCKGKYPNTTYKKLGQMLGNRDHSTIIHLKDAHLSLNQVDNNYHKNYNDLKNHLDYYFKTIEEMPCINNTYSYTGYTMSIA